MVRQDIIGSMAAATGKSEYEAKQMLEAAIEAMTQALQKGEEVVLRGFGTFKVKTRAPKLVRNINTGEEYYTPSTKKVVFEAGKNIQID